MASNPDLIKRKREDIRNEFHNKWQTKTYQGVPIYSLAYIYMKLGEKYYLSPKTIENILFHRVN